MSASLRGVAYATAAVVLMTACGSTPGDGASNSTAPSGPPAPSDAHPACVISADCPAGEHCDLGECVQDCSTKDPCTGELTCSPRARCLPPGQPDTDPKPTTRYAGSFDVTPKTIRLSDRDDSFDVQLTAKSSDPVRYRIELNGPHLSVDALRGEFREATTIRVHVDATKLHGRDVAGSIKFFTTLGEAVVNAPIHVGVTGSYRGALRYNSKNLTLGETRLALDVLERNGNVAVRVDSKASLLFPATATGETTGHGQFTASGGLDFTIAQVVEPTFGGDRNHFRRAVGRQVRIQAKPNANGDLAGAFTETITGLYSEPISVSGDVNLAFVPTGTDPEFNVAPDPQMPPSPAKTVAWSPAEVFGWTTGDCASVVCACDGASCWNGCDASTVVTTNADEAQYSSPLYTAFANRQTTSMPIDDIASSCKASLGTTSFATWSGSARQCGLVPPLACGALLRAQQTSTSDVGTGQHVVRLINDILAPSLLVAKNEVVVALADSFARGPAAEAKHYDTAMSTLGPSAAWVLQPALLEYLHGLSPQAAKGIAPTDNSTQSDTYPAARALADLFYTESTIDGERARLGAASSSGAQPQLSNVAQQRAVMTFLESMALAELVRAWGTVPDSVAVRYTGVLTPLNQGFIALQQGANAFGVPANFVPFVYRAEDVGKGATNFEQMLAIANDTVTAEKNLEAQFLADKRTYDGNQQDLQNQLTNVRTSMDTQIHAICGAAFDPNTVTSPDDWNRCGSDHGGAVGELAVEIDLANAKVASSHARIQGQRDKIKIDVAALAQKQKLRDDDIKFISATGDDLAALTFTDGVLGATEQALQIASNASIGNLGAPIAEAGVALAIGLMKSAIEAQKQQLETAQTVHTAQTNAAIEYIDGYTGIQKEMIDLAQLSVDILQDSLGVLETQVKQQNQVAQAKALFEERQRDLVLVGKNPANDPSYRLLRDQLGLQLLAARADAQRSLYLALSALEYELNMSIGAIDGAVLNASNGTSLDALHACAQGIFNQTRIAWGTPQDYVTEVSVAMMLGITGPRTDDVTGQTLSKGEQFRQLLLRNENLDGKGGVGVTFATDLLSRPLKTVSAGDAEGGPTGNLSASDVCADRIATVQAQLVGDFLGDNQAQVNLSLTGGSVMRACDSDALLSWSVSTTSSTDADAFAVLQAGTNTYGLAPPNSSLFGQSVARASWKVVIPSGAEAPSNADVDLTHVDDIVLKFDHKALPHRSSPVAIDLSCLAQIGGGQ